MTSETDCPFCKPEDSRVFHRGKDVYAMWDGFPVSPGHALVVPRRHVRDWFTADPAERAELWGAVDLVRGEIDKLHEPDGYNIGLNVGEAGGQTIFHLHLHVIPRYRGDVGDPRGGVRHVVPAKANYLIPEGTAGLVAETAPVKLVTGSADDPLLPHMFADIDRSIDVDIAVSFVLRSGIDPIQQRLRDLTARGGRLRILAGDYLDVTEPEALARILDLQQEAHASGDHGSVQARVFESKEISYHPKTYIFRDGLGNGVAYVGSSNLSRTALTAGIEWNYKIDSFSRHEGFAEVIDGFEALFHHPATAELDHDWLDSYKARRRTLEAVVKAEPDAGEAVAAGGHEGSADTHPPIPNEVQKEALDALADSRATGYTAALVVLATGVGKTWLAAFDAHAAGAGRVLFVAHRQELLAQARQTFRRIRPDARLGFYMGNVRESHADVLFASVQTIGKLSHLRQFAPGEFDYVVVDEFHHAAAASYRRVIRHFQPGFLLGLTATPERTDGGDLLALCQENLAYRCDVAEGIERGLLSPFHYYGVPDDVDYTNIPWRSARFDEESLTNALATKIRAQNILEQHGSRAGERTLAFCCSRVHADFMANYFCDHGLRAVAVHSGEGSAPRTDSLEKLEEGALDAVFAVDMFNEGVDIPHIDTVMMLRPTESKLLWLQQLGRGLRNAAGKSHLTVIDYIGNHRSFLVKAQALFQVGPGDAHLARVIESYEAGELELPPGCKVTYDVEAINTLKGLLTRVSQGDRLSLYYQDFKEGHGVRPSAVETFHDGYSPSAARRSHGSWVGFVRAMGDLPEEAGPTLDVAYRFLGHLERTNMERSYKMLLLKVMLKEGAVPGGMHIDELVREVRNLAKTSPVFFQDISVDVDDDAALTRLLETMPIEKWCKGRSTGGVSYFSYEDGVFKTTFDEVGERPDVFRDLVEEIVDWRIADYLMRDSVKERTKAWVCRLSHSGGRPLIFLPDRSKNPGIPTGWTPVAVEGDRYEANLVKVAINVMRGPGSGDNVLGDVLRRWFGTDAGLPGTNHRVVLKPSLGGYELAPVEVMEITPKLPTS